MEIDWAAQKDRVCGITAVLTAMAGLGSVQADTVAYWRFETGPANAVVEHVGRAGVFDGTTPDDSGNGNSLSVWTQGGVGGYVYRTEAPFSAVPNSGAPNRFSVQNSGPEPRLFTSAAGSVPSGINAQTMTPLRFTVEASYKPEANGGYRTVVSRDALGVSGRDANLAALYLQVRPDDSVGVVFTDVAGYTHGAYSYPGFINGFDYRTNPDGAGGPWYHLAGVSDGSTLRLYVNNALVASTDLTASGSPNRSLARGTTSGSTFTTGAWAVGRGLYGGAPVDYAYGFIDEVRLSNSALRPEEFLAAHLPRISRVVASDGNLTFSVTGGEPGGTCTILHAIDAVRPLAYWRSFATDRFDANGRCSFSTAVSPGAGARFFVLRTEVPSPPLTPLTYELSAGSETWPSDIRARIVAAMDGAVALYNQHGVFSKHLVANYDPGVPTAQAGYGGWIDFGGQIGYRTALHEISHTLGIGTVWNWPHHVQGGQWTGAYALRQVREFDGPGATLGADNWHFWPYGLNYENEASTENNRRHVLMVAAFRRDLGIE